MSPVIHGRRTYESMLEDLHGRAQIVLSRTEREYDIGCAYGADSVGEAVQVLESRGGQRAYVIGGADIYALFLPHLDRMVLSRISGEYEGDIYYPDWDTDE